MRNIQIFLMMLLLIIVPNALGVQATTIFPQRPTLPQESPTETIHSILMTEKNDLALLLETTKKKYPSIQINRVYDTVFHGVSAKGPRRDIESLKKEMGLKQSFPVTTYKVSLDESVPFIGGDEIRGLFDRADHRITGHGIKVGVIDTGIDYKHPDLKNSYHGGSDLVDGDSDPMETKGQAGLQTVHGTHVAGIIAANGKLKGVAPDAEIIAYRALGPGGVGTSEQVIAAIEQAIKDKVDIINLSLGNSINGPDWPTSVALDKAVENGIVAVTSSGNSGPEVWTVGSPGTSSKAISVGASTPPIEIPYLKFGSSKKEIDLIPMQNSKQWNLKKQYEIISAGIGKPEELKNVEGKVVLMERGELTFTEKALNALSKGAIGVLIYNNVKGAFAGSLEVGLNLPVASLSMEDGHWLKKKLESVENRYIRTEYRKQEDVLADFSSRGPVTETWEIKPDVVAPGVAIDSTVPNGYMALQGTSMAAPHVAGACALIKQAHPDWSPDQIKAALMNTAKKLRDENNKEYMPNEQGAGRIQLKEAIEAESLVYPSSLAFGLFQKQDKRTVKQIKITLDNQTNKQKTYHFNIPKNQDGLQWQLPQTVFVNGKEKKEVEITLDITPSVIGPGLHYGELEIIEASTLTKVPYMFVIDEPNYPRVMGFQFGAGDAPGTFKYELYLPRGADEYGIALYDPDTLQFITFLDWKREVSRGLLEREFKEEDIKLKGIYKAIVFANKDGQEDTIEADIIIDKNIIRP
ncbi:S8 family serine peptidase [Cytobacillus suaedae]|nr:S8 family serine peptidase [Cytobacillus suaedae]